MDELGVMLGVARNATALGGACRRRRAVRERERIASAQMGKLLPSLRSIGWSTLFAKDRPGDDVERKATVFPIAAWSVLGREAEGECGDDAGALGQLSMSERSGIYS